MKKNIASGNFEKGKTCTGILLLLPAIVLCSVFIVIPLLEVIHYSFFEWNGISSHMEFVGFRNYKELPSTEGFSTMAVWTIEYAIGVTILTVAISFLVALALDKKGKFVLNRTFLRALWFLPCLLSPAVIGILWHIMYNYNNGIVNSMLEILHLRPVNWLETYGVTNIAVIVATVWSLTGLCIVIFLAGLQSIPDELFEAADIDGATKRHVLLYITVPMMAPSITINVLTTSITAFKMYELPLFVSEGLPGYSTKLLTQRIYFFGFFAREYGIGSALSVLLIILITGISLLQFVYLKKREEIF
jgi:ABC-type sugar transport system permease subunit